MRHTTENEAKMQAQVRANETGEPWAYFPWVLGPWEWADERASCMDTLVTQVNALDGVREWGITFPRTERVSGREDGDCVHEPATRIVPPLGSPLPTCIHCGVAYMLDD